MATATDPRDGAIPEPVIAAWQQVVDGWDDPSRHDALIALISQYGCYAWAAARYKPRAGDPIADRQLERLRKAATATMFATATARRDADDTPYKSTIRMFAIMVVVLIIGLLCGLLLGNRSKPPAAREPGAVPQRPFHPPAGTQP